MRDTHQTQLVYLRGDYELIKRRMEARQDHYFEANMLKGQFEIFEEPRNSVVVSIHARPHEIVKEIIRRLDLSNM